MRDGFCHTEKMDRYNTTICVKMTKEFLDHCLNCGLDYRTSHSIKHFFTGLKEGDRWAINCRRFN